MTFPPSVDAAAFPLLLVESFVSPDEETALVAETDKLLRRRRYEASHWDAVITSFRELQIPTPRASPLLQAVFSRAWTHVPRPSLQRPKDHVHVLDLAPGSGNIDYHVDSVKFSGDVVCGLSLLSPSVLRLRRQAADYDPSLPGALPPEGLPVITVELPPRSLYMLVDESRYDWAHAIAPVGGGRRISLIFRDEGGSSSGSSSYGGA